MPPARVCLVDDEHVRHEAGRGGSTAVDHRVGEAAARPPEEPQRRCARRFVGSFGDRGKSRDCVEAAQRRTRDRVRAAGRRLRRATPRPRMTSSGQFLAQAAWGSRGRSRAARRRGSGTSVESGSACSATKVTTSPTVSDDLVELHPGDPADEVHRVAIAGHEPFRERDELDALELQVGVERVSISTSTSRRRSSPRISTAGRAGSARTCSGATVGSAAGRGPGNEVLLR